MNSTQGTAASYEQERADRMAENKRKIEELGLVGLSQNLVPESMSQPSKKGRMSQKEREFDSDYEPRASSRVSSRPKVSYYEAGNSPREAREPRGPPGPEEVERLRKLHSSSVATTKKIRDTAAVREPKVAKPRKAIDSGKGVRIQGGRVYDSSSGTTCHWCRQKTVEEHVTCTLSTCGGGRRLPTTFCKMCLKNRHGESVHAALAAAKWVCPCCRVSCGFGCLQCCNCGPCRKKNGQDPTHQVLRSAKDSGFSNVHDFLVHLTSGETAEQITARKLQHPWGQWMKACTGGPSCSSAAPACAHVAAPSETATAAEPPATDPKEVADAPQAQAEVAEPTAAAATTTIAGATKPAASKKPTQPASTNPAPAVPVPASIAAALPTQTTREARANLRKSLDKAGPLPTPSAPATHLDNVVSAPNVVAPKRRRSKSAIAADVVVADEAAAADGLENVNSPVKAGVASNGLFAVVAAVEESVVKAGAKDGAVVEGEKDSQDERAPPTPQTLDKRGPVQAHGRATRGAGRSKAAGKAVPVLLAF